MSTAQSYRATVQALSEQRDTLLARVRADRERIAHERTVAYREGFKAGYHAAKRRQERS